MDGGLTGVCLRGHRKASTWLGAGAGLSGELETQEGPRFQQGEEASAQRRRRGWEMHFIRVPISYVNMGAGFLPLEKGVTSAERNKKL